MRELGVGAVGGLCVISAGVHPPSSHPQQIQWRTLAEVQV